MYLLEFTLELGILIPAIVLFFIALFWLVVEFKAMKDAIRERMGINNDSIKLRLQAYERLALYAERAGLRNMVANANYGDQGAAALHSELITQLKSEYDYNITQQIYVSKEVWSALTRFKDQNIFIINQLAGSLPYTATGLDLKKVILEYSMTDKAELNVIVLDALQFEAKQIFK